MFQLSWKWPFRSFECSNSPFTSKCYPFLNCISLFKFFLLKNLQKNSFLYTFKKNCPWRLQTCKSFKNFQPEGCILWKIFKNLQKTFKSLHPEGIDLCPGLYYIVNKYQVLSISLIQQQLCSYSHYSSELKQPRNKNMIYMMFSVYNAAINDLCGV